MKSFLLFCALFSATTSFAGSTKVLMLDYVGTDMDRMFEIKTSQYDKVILDCQSFIQGMTFYNKGEVVHNFYIDSYECEGAHDYLQSAKDQNIAICFEIEDKQLNFVETLAPSECK